MIEKLPPLSLADGMKIWREIYSDGPETSHLTPTAIHSLSRPGGLENALNTKLDHLSSCPECLKQWSTACSQSTLQGEDAADDWYSGGMLEAAASQRSPGIIVLPSNCENFEIRLLPQDGSTKKYMAVVEVVSLRKSDFENSHIFIKDKDGKLLLEGKVAGARLAREIEDLDEFDISAWSMIVKFPPISKK